MLLIMKYSCKNWLYMALRGTSLRWFESYLSNRSHCIVDGLKMSSRQTIKIGILQESVLAPVLFLIFINDMPLHLQTDTDIYADDTITHTAGKRIVVVEPRLQMSAGDFTTWCIDNNVGVHYGKNIFIRSWLEAYYIC